MKIKNRGTQTANNVVVRGFHTKPAAGLLWPNDFEAFATASINVGTLGANNSEEKIVGPFEWQPNINAYGHDCMLMIASATSDPSNIDNFTAGEVIPEWRLVPNDNNIGQRNVNVIPGGGGGGSLMEGLHGFPFWVGNPNPKRAVIDIDIAAARAPRRARLERSASRALRANRFTLREPRAARADVRGRARQSLRPSRRRGRRGSRRGGHRHWRTAGRSAAWSTRSIRRSSVPRTGLAARPAGRTRSDASSTPASCSSASTSTGTT